MNQPISSLIPNLVNGVSQQPPELRFPSQAERVVNFLPSVSAGCSRRPPVRVISRIDDGDLDDAFHHSINRDTTERYSVVVSGGELRVFDTVTGEEKTVNAPDGMAYLNTTGPTKRALRALTVADYTLFLNTEVVAAMDSAVLPPRSNQALVFVRGGNYGKAYDIFINDSLRSRAYTPLGNDPVHVTTVNTSTIAFMLYQGLTGTPAQLMGWGTAWSYGSGDFSSFSYDWKENMITITSTNTTPFDIRVDDGTAGIAISAFTDRAQRFSDLPVKAPDGYTIEIVGDNSSRFDNYYVKYDATGGVWMETARPGIEYRVDAATMPHILVREADGTFTFRQADWSERTVGDTDSAPNPSFIGRRIRDIFFYRNRLGLLSDDSVSMSVSGDLFNFWRGTATTTLDTDPIDVTVTTPRVPFLEAAVPFNEVLLLFSPEAQFVLQGGDLLTPGTVSVTESSAFTNSSLARPVVLGSFVYFTTPKGNHTGVREYAWTEEVVTIQAPEITSHVPSLIPKNVTAMVGSTVEEALVLLSEDAPNKLWVYRYYFGSEGKLQSAWVEWDLGSDTSIRDIQFIDSRLFMVVHRAGDGSYIEVMDFRPNESYPGWEDKALYLDRAAAGEDPVYNPTTESTTFTLPYRGTEGVLAFVRVPDTTNYGTIVVPVVNPDGTVTVPGNRTAEAVYFGYRFTSTYTFSPLYVRQQSGNGSVVMSNGRLQLRRMGVDYVDSGEFSVTVENFGRDPITMVCTQFRADTSPTDAIPTGSGRFSFPIMSQNTATTVTLSADCEAQVTFTSAEWEGVFFPRTNRV